MPTTPYARLRVRVNGGAPQTGAVTIAAGDTIQFEAESYDGWTSPAARWEIYEYPEGWTGPGGAWSSEAVTQPDGTVATVFYWLGNSPPPSFAAPVITYWGKFMPRLFVNGGIKGGLNSDDLEDVSTALEMLSANGFHDIAWREGTQFGAYKKWVRDWQRTMRLLDSLVGGCVTAYEVLPEPVEIGAGSFGLVNQYSRGDHSHPVTVGAATTIAIGDAAAAGGGTALAGAGHKHALPAPTVVGNVDAGAGALGVSAAVAREDHAHQVVTGTPVDVGTANDAGVLNALARADHVHNTPFSAVNTALGNANATIEINGQMLNAGSVIADYFASKSANAAASGLLRAVNASTAVAFRNAANSGDLPAIACDGLDALTIGDSGFQNITYQTATGTFQYFKVGTATPLTLNTTVATVFSLSPDNGGGDGVMQIGNATTEPTTGAGNSALVWTFGGTLKAKSEDNIRNTIVSALDAGTPAGSDLRAKDRPTARVMTADATVTTAITYALPEGCTAVITAEVAGYRADASAGYRIIHTFKRPGAGPAASVGIVNKIAQEDDSAWDANLVTSGNDVLLQVTGKAATDIEWFCYMEVFLLAP